MSQTKAEISRQLDLATELLFRVRGLRRPDYLFRCDVALQNDIDEFLKDKPFNEGDACELHHEDYGQQHERRG